MSKEDTTIALLEQRLNKVEENTKDIAEIKTNVALILQKLEGLDVNTSNLRLDNAESNIKELKDDVKTIGTRLYWYGGGLAVIIFLVSAYAFPYLSQRNAIRDSNPPVAITAPSNNNKFNFGE